MGSYSSTMRYTGLSGVDTESMVQAMMKAESYKYDILKKTRQRTSWRQEAYQTHINAIQSFYKSFLDLTSSGSLRNSSTFLKNTATVSVGGNASKAITVQNSSGAELSSYSVVVEKLATKDTYVGDSVQGVGIKGTQDFDVSKLQSTDSINVTLDGRTVEISFSDFKFTEPGYDEDDFVSDLNGKLQTAFGTDSDGNAKVSVSLVDVDVDNNATGKLSFSTNASVSHTLKVSEASGRESDIIADDKITFNEHTKGNESEFKVGNQTIKFTVGEDLDETISNIRSALTNAGINNISVSAGGADGDKIKFSAIGTTESINLTDLTDLGFSGDITLEPTSVLASMGGIKNNSVNVIDTSKSIKDVFGDVGDDNLATGGKEIVLTINGETIELDTSKSVRDLISAVNNSKANVTMSFDSISQKFKIESKDEGSLNAIDFTGENSFLGNLGISTTATTAASDSIFTVNGVRYERSSNNVSVGGISMTLNEESTPIPPAQTTDPPTPPTYEAVTIEINKNTDAIFDTVKTFVEAYNKLIEGINGAVNQPRAKTGNYSYYEPLTDDEKSALSDSEIKAWEEKAKEGLLYRDDILSGFTSSLRSALYSSVTLDDGRKISLYEIGITTSSTLSDQGKLVIDEEKLREAIESRGDDIGTLFHQTSTGLGDRLNKIVTNYVGRSGRLTEKAGNSEYSVSMMDNALYNDLKRQDERIADMLASLRKKEDNYYLKFSRMESALTETSSQMSYLQSMLG